MSAFFFIELYLLGNKIPYYSKSEKETQNTIFLMVKVVNFGSLAKLAIPPDYKRPRLLGLAWPSLAALSKIWPDFSKKLSVFKIEVTKNHFHKKYAPKFLFFDEIFG